MDQIREDRTALDKRFGKLREQSAAWIGMFRVDVHRDIPDAQQGHTAAGLAGAMDLHDMQLGYQIRLLNSLKEDAKDLEGDYRDLLARTEALQAVSGPREAALLEYTKEGLLMSIQQIVQQQILLENEIQIRTDLQQSFGQAQEAAQALDGTERAMMEERLRKKLREEFNV